MKSSITIIILFLSISSYGQWGEFIKTENSTNIDSVQIDLNKYVVSMGVNEDKKSKKSGINAKEIVGGVLSVVGLTMVYLGIESTSGGSNKELIYGSVPVILTGIALATIFNHSKKEDSKIDSRPYMNVLKEDSFVKN